MDEQISRAEHEEFSKRITAENDRQNKRIEILEKAVTDIKSLTIEVSKLATNMSNMLEVQKEHGQKLDELENQDGEMWRKVVSYAITAVVGVVIGLFFKNIGF